jgi:hypothetical protein
LAPHFVLDPDGITRTKTLGIERMAHKLADALPGGGNRLSAAVREFLRPMLSPRLAIHRDAFVFDERVESSDELAAHHGGPISPTSTEAKEQPRRNAPRPDPQPPPVPAP